jgi:hypothetical protein
MPINAVRVAPDGTGRVVISFDGVPTGRGIGAVEFGPTSAYGDPGSTWIVAITPSSASFHFRCDLDGEQTQDFSATTQIEILGADTAIPGGAEISWSTPFDGIDNEVAYGLDSNYGTVVKAAAGPARAHSANITGLAVGTYHYQCRSKKSGAPADEDYVRATSDDTFTVAPAGPVDFLSLEALPERFSQSQNATATVVAKSGGAPVSGKTVQFSLDHGSSQGHGTFNPTSAQTDANGTATSVFTASRPGRIKLKADCDGESAKDDVLVRPG